jgi:hypothetical protein
MSGCVARMKEVRNEYRNLTGIPFEKHPLARPRRGKDNIKMDLMFVDGTGSGSCPISGVQRLDCCATMLVRIMATPRVPGYRM